ncbi:MAG: hypothetical protein AUH33_00905 [Chloroflexi bacterium 13_1_40CM_68_21]|nr:MAG: hypothetical protein AUH33_00905 [Chloroflexi bacterium 13_1_40CM_68_21]
MRASLLVPLVLGGLAALAASQTPVSDSDLFWHLAIGRDVAAHGIARLEMYSWTVAGRPVLVDQWLGEIVLSVAYAIGSWRGIITLRAIVVGAIAALVVWTALVERPRRPLIAVLAALPALALSRFAWTDRPELFGLLCFTILVALFRAGRRGALRAFALCPPLLLIWANLHGSYALGLGLAILVGLERLLVDAPRRRQYAALAVACALATFVTPAGLGTWTSSGGHFLAPPRFVQEEGTPDVATLPGALFSVALLATLGSALLAPRARRRDVLFDIAMLVPVAFVSLTATRHLVFFPIAAAPFLSKRGPDAVAAAWEQVQAAWFVARRTRGLTAQRESTVHTSQRETTAQVEGTREHGRSLGPLAADAIAGAIALILLISGAATAPTEPDLSGFPVTALSQLPAGPGLLNRYDWGGFLIWYAPATPVFVDGRLFPYVGDALDDYRSVIGLHPGWPEVLARRGIRTVLVGPSDAIAVHAADLGWPVLARTEKYVLLRVP